MAKCKSPARSATQEQVRKPKLAGKVKKQKIGPKLIEGRSLTLLKKGEELATLCNAQVAVLIYGFNGSVQTWPNNSNTVKDILLQYKHAASKKISERSFKSMKHKVADTTGEGLNQNPCFEGLDDHTGYKLRDEEFGKLPQESLMGLTGNFLESKEQNSDETINLIEGSSQPIEGSKAIDHPDNNSNCNSPIELAENIWEDPMSEDFDKGQTLFTDSICPWQACEYTGFDSGIETSTSNSCLAKYLLP
ncbi:agamous-like MADS-box protein AGL103 [Rosa rugosa]|uniref:agamous-like MADS-box protein AGL103 n=1 Tax=Rosa rugosa TaxID=74645 RepID=UPI002B4164AA|nr:agamous-like MADS-box protein AGL103 [Rosa rugosa]